MKYEFCFNLLNHNELGQRSLEDVIGIFGKQLRALGHIAVWDTRNDRFLQARNPLNGEVAPSVNILVEGFTPSTTDVMRAAHAQGCRFLILATEEPTLKDPNGSYSDPENWLGFNHGTQPEMVARMFEFPKAAAFCEGIIHLVPGEHVRKWYSQFAPTTYIELGYAPSLVRVDRTKPPEYDFAFYGSLTPRRYRILKKLARHIRHEKAIRICSDFKSQQERDDEMRRGKVILQIRKFDEMGLVSSSRCNTALCLGRPVVAEPHNLSHPWDEVVTFSRLPTPEKIAERTRHEVGCKCSTCQNAYRDLEFDDFINRCLLAKATWEGLWYQQFERFKQRFAPMECAGQALKDLGLMPTYDLTAPKPQAA